MIREYGLLWDSEKVEWRRSPGLIGVAGSAQCDFYNQLGVYILYGKSTPFYVGLAQEEGSSIGERLRFHQKNKSRKYPNLPQKWWTHFSWFGFREAAPSKPGEPYELKSMPVMIELGGKQAIAEIEALLIKSFVLNNKRPQRFALGRQWQQVG